MFSFNSALSHVWFQVDLLPAAATSILWIFLFTEGLTQALPYTCSCHEAETQEECKLLLILGELCWEHQTLTSYIVSVMTKNIDSENQNSVVAHRQASQEIKNNAKSEQWTRNCLCCCTYCNFTLHVLGQGFTLEWE